MGNDAALSSPTPILVAVTGHRDLRPADLERLQRLVDEFFDDLTLTFPNSQIVVLSALAAGSDRVVAERALSRGMAMVAVLPMPADDYRADFTEAGDLAAFDSLLARAASVVELPWADGIAPDGRHEAAARTAQYVAVGDVLVQNAAIVLALWNGQMSTLRGGTADVVRAARAAAHPARTLLAPVEHHLAPLVYHIITPRMSQPDTLGDPFSHTTFADVAGDATLRAIAQQDRWNRDAREFVREASGSESFAIDRRLVAKTFDVADALAIREQVATQRAFARIYLLGGLATLCFALYVDLLANLNWLLYVAVSITVAGVFAYYFSSKRRASDTFQDYRALAEGLRIQIAWIDAGIASEVGDYYLRRHRSSLDVEDAETGSAPASKLDWIRRTIRVAHQFQTLGAPRRPVGTHDGRDPRERFRVVLDEWIAPQASYFARAAARKRTAAARYRAGWKSAAALTTAVTVALTIAVSIPSIHDATATYKDVFFFVIGAAGVLSALLQSYAEKRAFAALAKQYESMHRTFVHAAQALEAMLDGDFHESKARALVFELGTEALAENAEWVIALRDRPLEMILTG